jgi:DNA sulfur modification protein DndD
VDRYFPNASHQVVLLSTDEEIDAGLLVRLAPRIGRMYQLVHEDTSGATRIEPGYFWEGA